MHTDTANITPVSAQLESLSTKVANLELSAARGYAYAYYYMSKWEGEKISSNLFAQRMGINRTLAHLAMTRAIEIFQEMDEE